MTREVLKRLRERLLSLLKKAETEGFSVPFLDGVRHEDLEALASRLGLKFLKREGLPQEHPLIEGFPVPFLLYHAVIPLKVEGRHGVVVVGNPLNLSLIENLRILMGVDTLEVVVADPNDIRDVLQHFFQDTSQQMEEAVRDLAEEAEEEQLRFMAMEAPIIRLVNSIISRAVEARASDVHFEPYEDVFKVRYRIDGILHDVEYPPKRLQSAIVTRLKLMANLNIAEHRLPQDGRIKVRLGGKEVDIRVSTVPTVFGESVVLRLLYQDQQEFELETLGLSERDYAVLDQKIRLPNGIILVTGPTGSGKTTTLYAVLKRINSPDKKIITVEDPVEYQIPGISQIQVRPEIGLTFANLLRSIVRQDPDVILIGEIRDFETAEIAVQASLTGHLVFSTLHTNDAPTAITRLVNLGVEPFLISASLVAVVAQRLVRVLCPYCKVPLDSQTIKKKALSLLAEFGEPLPEEVSLFRPLGCVKCANTGYRGRTGIFEVMDLDEDLRGLIAEGAETEVIREKAISKGMKPMVVDGIKKVLRGETTLEEVMRVTRG